MAWDGNIGSGVVVVCVRSHGIYAVTEEDGRVTLTDPYEVEKPFTMDRKAFEVVMREGAFKFGWTFEEAKNWR